MLDTQRYKRTDTRFYKRKGPLEDRVEQDILRYGRPLNIEQESDIERMFTEIPELAIGNNATKGWAFCHPPTLAWEKDEFALDETGRYVVETYFSPFRWEAYIRGLRKFGIIPFKYKQIDEWQYPVMPPVGSGIIYQYYDKEDMVYHYRWQWKNQTDTGFDPDMHFYIWYQPTDNGDFTSPAMAILNDWKISQQMSLTTLRIAHQASRLPVFMIHRPPKGAPGDKKFEFEFADNDDVESARNRHNRELEKGIMSQNANREAVEYSRALNEGRATTANLLATGTPFGHKPLLNSESLMQIEQREGNTMLDRLYYLDDHWEPAPASGAVLPADPLLFSTRLGQVAAGCVDFPVVMLDRQGQRAGNFDAQLTFAKNRMEETLASMGIFLKTVLLDSNARILKGMYRDRVAGAIEKRRAPLSEDEMMKINIALKGFTIIQKCTPLITQEQVTALWEMGVLSHKGYTEQTAHLLGIPEMYLENGGEGKPLLRKRELEMKQLDLAEKQFKLSQQTAQKQQTLAEKQFSLAEEQQAHQQEQDEVAAAAEAQKPPKKSKTSK